MRSDSQDTSAWKYLQKKSDAINVHDSLSPAEVMYEIQSQAVTRDMFLTPGVNGYASQLSTYHPIDQNER